jgi:hypothetical protein
VSHVAPTERYVPRDPAEAAAVAAAADASRKRCPRCERVKPRGAFPPRSDRPGKLRSWCRTCDRLIRAARQQAEPYRAARAAYEARPEVRERRRRSDAARKGRRRRADAERRQQRREARARWRGTPLGKLRNGRSVTLARLRAATDPARVERLTVLLAQYDRELARMGRRARKPRPAAAKAKEATP